MESVNKNKEVAPQRLTSKGSARGAGDAEADKTAKDAGGELNVLLLDGDEGAGGGGGSSAGSSDLGLVDLRVDGRRARDELRRELRGVVKVRSCIRVSR